MPIYVLHQTVIVLLGFYVVEWPISATVKYLTISLISLAIIFGVYDLAVRRTTPTRFLFGMKQPERERRVSANGAGTPSSTHGR